MYKLEDCINQTLNKVQCRKSLLILLFLSINAPFFPEYCHIENYIHVVRSATFHLQLK